MGIKVITPPADALTLEELRLQCRIDAIGGTHFEDDWLLDTCKDAVAFAEHYTQQSIGEQTVELALDAFPEESGGIELLRGPATDIVSVTYIDQAGDEQTIATNLYALDDYSNPQWLVPKYGTTWPTTASVINAVKVRYVAGVPVDGSIKQALKLYVSNEFDNGRGGGSQKDYETALDAVRTKLNTVKRWGH